MTNLDAEMKQKIIDKLTKAEGILEGFRGIPGLKGLGTAMGLVNVARISVECFWCPERDENGSKQ